MNRITPQFLLSLVMSLTLALLAACAGLDELDPGIVDPEPQTKAIHFGCWASIGEGPDVTYATWELTVDPRPIVSGEDFAADLQGKVIFDEAAMASTQTLIEGGFKDAMIVDLKATVHVRRGATGEDVALTLEPIQHVCAVSKTACDPDNDLPGTPGIRGNTDCEPQGAINPCGRFVEIPTSDDCAPGGFCEGEGRTGPESQCELNEFCVSGPAEAGLEKRVEGYQADVSGNVLFGFDDQNTSAEILQEGGCNDGTWFMPKPSFDDPLGPNSVRIIAGGIPVAIECVMGEASRGPFGIDSCDAHSSPTPDSRLISFPIQVP